MTWALSAHGETNDAAEQEMKEALIALLSDPKYGALGSQFSGAGHNGPVHHAKPAGKKDRDG